MLFSNKRTKLLTTVAAGLILLGCGDKVIDGASVSKADSPPNIVLIFIDDMGYADLSSYGGNWVQTPHIDALAKSGVRFTDGYSVAPVCGPSRVGLLTGAYPARFGVFWNDDTLKTRLPERQTLLPDLVRQAGYTSAVIGKWNLPSRAVDHADIVKDEMIWGGAYWPDEQNIYKGVGGGYGAGGTESGKWGPEREGEEYLTDRLSQHAVNFINDTADNPFFLYLAYNSPHSPLQAHKRYKTDVAHLPDMPTQIYAAMLLSIDDGVGQVMQALGANGLKENTLVFFISDNGPAASDFNGYQEDWPQMDRIGQTGPLRGGKRQLYDGGIRVPFIASWPSQIAAQQTVATPVTTLDVYKTVADITDISLPEDILTDGESLLKILDTPETYQTRELFWTGRTCAGKICNNFGAVRRGDFKWIEPDKGLAALYNLRADIGETRDLTSSEKQISVELQARYNDWYQTLPKASSKEINLKNVMGQPPKEKPLSPILTGG